MSHPDLQSIGIQCNLLAVPPLKKLHIQCNGDIIEDIIEESLPVVNQRKLISYLFSLFPVGYCNGVGANSPMLINI